MLSKKMAFSLVSLITIFALAFAVPSVMAADEITPTLSADTTAYGEIITVTIAFDKVVGIANVNAKMPTVMTVTAAGAAAAPTAATGTTIDATSGVVTVNVQKTRILWRPGFKLMIKSLNLNLRLLPRQPQHKCLRVRTSVELL